MGKTVLITGSSRGIGAETAKLFARSGYNVVINYNHSEEEAIALFNELRFDGLSVILCKADISLEFEAELMFDKITDKFGGVDILVNNAGISEQKLFIDLSEHDWDRMFDNNLKGLYNCTHAALPYMINQRYGKIINISSVWGLMGASMEISYSTTKAAIIGFSKALAKEYGPSNINVNCITPGVIDTDMNKHLDKDAMKALLDDIPLMRIGKSKEVAELILFFASEKANYITGQTISIDGGFGI